MKPLNGDKTHPLTAKAIEVLTRLRSRPIPRLEINAGIVNRLQRENLVSSIQLPSPYKSHKGGNCEYLEITAAGLERIEP